MTIKIHDMIPGYFYAVCDDHGEYRTRRFPAECPKCSGNKTASKLRLTKTGDTCRKCKKGTMKLKVELMVKKYNKSDYKGNELRKCNKCGFESV